MNNLVKQLTLQIAEKDEEIVALKATVKQLQRKLNL
jgi:hypothetical protein